MITTMSFFYKSKCMHTKTTTNFIWTFFLTFIKLTLVFVKAFRQLIISFEIRGADRGRLCLFYKFVCIPIVYDHFEMLHFFTDAMVFLLAGESQHRPPAYFRVPCAMGFRRNIIFFPTTCRPKFSTKLLDECGSSANSSFIRSIIVRSRN